MADGLQAATLWITVARASAGGRSCRDYAVCDVSGAVLLAARAFPWRREFAVVEADTGQTVLRVRRRVSFPLNGRTDILGAEGELLGAAYRNGRCADGAGVTIGRFRNARSLRSQVGESVLAGLADALLGAESTGLSSHTAYIFVARGQSVGTLARARVPWPPPPAAEGSALLAAADRFLPARLRNRVHSLAAPAGWRYERGADLLGAEPLLTIGAALFQVELAQW